MKYNYKKPEIVFDRFTLSQSIAANCEFISNATRGLCAVDTGLEPLFVEAVQACLTHPGPGNYDDVCYDVPNQDYNVFSS